METRKTIRKWLKRLLIACFVFGLLFASFVLGKIDASIDEPYKDEHAKARNALQLTGIRQDFDPDFVFHGSHIGRDMFSQTFFEVSYGDRKELMRLIRSTDGWHSEALTAKDYCDFVEITWYPSMIQHMISDDIVFDAWFYRETTPSAGFEPMLHGYFSFLGQAARGFEFAVFDEDTGLFIFIDQFG